jgi:uncharacterized membrane protein YfcA
LIVVLFVGLVGFMISSTFGVGGALLLIPLLAQKMPASQAVAISAPVMLLNNVLKSWVFRRHVDVRAFLLVSGLALPAAGIAAYFAARFDDRAILIGVALLIVLHIVVERFLEKRIQVSPRALFFWGGVTGAVSGLCGAAGPPTAIGLRGFGLEKERFVGTVAWFAVLLQAVKIPAYVSTGALPAEHLPLAAALGALAVVSVLVAPRLLRSLPKRAFANGLDGLLFVSAVAILVDVVRR